MKKTDTQGDFNPFDLYVPENGADFYQWLHDAEIISRLLEYNLEYYIRETEIEAHDKCPSRLLARRWSARQMRHALKMINETVHLALESIDATHICTALKVVHKIRKENLKKLQAEKEDKQ